MAVYLYRPPTWQNVQMFPGAWVLRCGITTSTCVYRRNGVWVNVLEAGPDDVENIDVDEDTGLRLFFTKPMVIPDTLYDQLSALEPADPSWAPGELILL